MDDKQKQQRQHSINTVVVGILAGILTGFIVAMLLGAFKVGGNATEGITNWLQAASGVVAALISAYAVYLVAQTLRATQDTLAATVKMAHEQAAIGDAQTRPWLMLEDCKLGRNQYEEWIRFDFKNLGPTPARNLVLVVQLIDINTFDKSGETERVVTDLGTFEASVIGSGKTISYSPKLDHIDLFSNDITFINLIYEYKSADGGREYSETYRIDAEYDGDFDVTTMVIR